ncbi:hypothetical protein C7212DRAFT_362120 [Tuber magnatum]|uniref:Uncharacterized protein n=1 Tax=Tuber magnatum TaxID=42249 RepID=A0A317T4C5_9PEZI|nr:hypothetical protein C7212DRAFT_362120 [Tuber magnatum]
MFRLSRQTKILSPALIHRRIWFRGFRNVFTPDGTRNDGTRNDGHGGQSGIFWDRINRLNDKIDGCIKDHSTFKVDIIKSINDGNAEIHKQFTKVHKEFADWRSDQKLMKWEIHFLFFRALSV